MAHFQMTNQDKVRHIRNPKELLSHMKREGPKKIAIIRVPGSGKSTFAFKLSKALNLPVHHLDGHVFELGARKEIKRNLLRFKRLCLVKKGGLSRAVLCSTYEMRFSKADTVISLSIPAFHLLLENFQETVQL